MAKILLKTDAKQQQNDAVTVATVIDAVLGGQLRNSNKIRKSYDQSLSRYCYPGTTPGYLRKVWTALFGSPENIDMLRGFLGKFKELSPEVLLPSRNISLFAEKNAEFHELMTEALNAGELEFMYREDSRLVEYVSECRGKICSAMEESDAFKKKDAATLLKLFMGTDLLINMILNVMKSEGCDEKIVGESFFLTFVKDGIAQIRSAISCAVLRKLSEDHPGLNNEMFPELERIMGLHIQDDFAPPEDELPCFKSYVGLLKQSRWDTFKVFIDQFSADCMPELAEDLRHMQISSEYAKRPIESPALPWGEVMLVVDGVLPDEKIAMYKVDGRKDVATLAVVDTRGEHNSVPTCANGHGPNLVLTAPNAMMCAFDREGEKLFASEASRLIPIEPRKTEKGEGISKEDMDVLRSARRDFGNILNVQWNNHPELFALLPDLQPFILVTTEGKTVAMIAGSQCAMVTKALEREVHFFPAKEVLSSRGFRVDDSLVAFTLAESKVSPQPDVGSEVHQSRRYWRKMIRTHFPHSVPSYDWAESIFHKLAISNSNQGKGSHSSLHLGGKRDTVTSDIKNTTESLCTGILISMIEHLGVSPEAFLEEANK